MVLDFFVFLFSDQTVNYGNWDELVLQDFATLIAQRMKEALTAVATRLNIEMDGRTMEGGFIVFLRLPSAVTVPVLNRDRVESLVDSLTDHLLKHTLPLPHLLF